MVEHIEKTNQQVWKLKGVTYVPHYSKPDTFVGPGWTHWVANERGETAYYPPEYTLLDLIGKGAVAAEMFLWAR